MEELLKKLVTDALEARGGERVEISNEEWNEAKTEALNDIYANILCLLDNVTSDYFINIMASYLEMSKRGAA